MAEFVGVETRIFGTVLKTVAGKLVVAMGGGTIQACGNFQTGERLLVCIRPEDIALHPVAGRDSNHNESNKLLARIVKVRPWAAQQRVELDCGGDRIIALISRSSLPDSAANEGEQVIVSFRESAVHLIEEA